MKVVHAGWLLVLALAACDNQQAPPRVTMPCSCAQAGERPARPRPDEARVAPGPTRTAISRQNDGNPQSPTHANASMDEPQSQADAMPPDIDVRSVDGREPRIAIWLDGYGRRHMHIVIDIREDRRRLHRQWTNEIARLDPWHGYNPHNGPRNGY
jgi:hypothetical protein